MTTSEAPARACSWDSDQNPAYNLYVRGNAEEIVPGITTPFTATIFQEMEYLGIGEMYERLEIEDLMQLYPAPVSNFMGIFGGRCVLNLAWANAIITTWTTSEGSGLMEQFITTDQADVGSGSAADKDRAARVQRSVYTRFWPQAVAAIEANNRKIRGLRDDQAHRDLRTMGDRALLRYLLSLAKVQSHVFVNHLGASGAAGEFASITAKLLAADLGDRFEESMVAGLTTGLGEIESSMPGYELWKLGRLVAARPKLAKQVAAMSARDIDAALAHPADDDWRAFAQAFAEFIDAYGFRGQSEADPAYPSWSEDHTFVLSVIKTNAAAGDDRDPRKHAEVAQHQREQLEERIEGMLSPGARRGFRKYAGWTQRYARARERTKACWVRGMRLSRPVFLEMARRCEERGITQSQDDFWYLTYPEVRAILMGEREASYAERIAARRAERERLAKFNVPEVFIVPITLEPIEAVAPSGPEMTGLGVSVGVASGRARVIASAAAAEETDLEPGEVLIAPFTDAAWTPLFVPAAAVVVETGGMLSHAATVAREYGIPAVVAVKGATTLIKDGEMVTVDGTAGLVRIG